MTQGLPPQPTIRSIVGGIGLFVLVCAAFAALPNLVKWAGAALTFIPGQLGLIDVVHGSEVMPVDMTSNPTPVSFAGAGDYLLYTSNYDLLVINDAVAAVHAKPWFRLTDEAGEEVSITLVERGLAVFDTPLASGRPVVLQDTGYSEWLPVGEGVLVRVGVAVLVRVGVLLRVVVRVGVFVPPVAVLVGVLVRVGVLLRVGVRVGVLVPPVAVLVGVLVAVFVGVEVAVCVAVPVGVSVGVSVGTIVLVDVRFASLNTKR